MHVLLQFQSTPLEMSHIKLSLIKIKIIYPMGSSCSASAQPFTVKQIYEKIYMLMAAPVPLSFQIRPHVAVHPQPKEQESHQHYRCGPSNFEHRNDRFDKFLKRLLFSFADIYPNHNAISHLCLNALLQSNKKKRRKWLTRNVGAFHI